MTSSNPLAALRSEGTRHARATHNLLFVRSGRESFRVPAPAHSLRIGRGRDCDIRLPDPGRVLSRIHLVVERRPGAVAVRDCSTNGSRVNGEVLSQAARRLRPGDCVTAGPWEIRVEQVDEPRAAARPMDGVDSTTLPLDKAAWNDSTYSPVSTGVVAADEPLIVGQSPAIRRCLARLLRLARFDVPVVILGETGTGKELIARALHDQSSRSAEPYVALNCGAIHRETANSTLFGHEPGSFTGARGRRKGMFEEAGSGTLFLDEVGELSLELQASLLRVLETGEVRAMGATKTTSAQCRLIAATHRDLVREAAEGRFRSDLYYRIQVASIRVPALRDRGDDVLLLARHFLRRHSPGAPPVLAASARESLLRHSWPGNVRELRNVVLRALIQCDDDVLHAEQLEFDPGPTMPLPSTLESHHALPPARRTDEVLRGELLRSLHLCGGNRSRAARDLGISRSTLYARMERLGLVAGSDPHSDRDLASDIVDP